MSTRLGLCVEPSTTSTNECLEGSGAIGVGSRNTEKYD